MCVNPWCTLIYTLDPGAGGRGRGDKVIGGGGGGGEPALGPLPETGLRIAMGPFVGDISTQVGWFHGVSIVYKTMQQGIWQWIRTYIHIQGSKIQVLGDQKISEDNQELRPGCPPDYQIICERIDPNIFIPTNLSSYLSLANKNSSMRTSTTYIK